MPAADFDLYLVTDRQQTRDRDLLRVLQEALDGGVDAVQLREKDLGGKDLFLLAESARKLTNRYSARLYVNDRIDVASAVEADGVQLGNASMPIAAARQILGAQRCIGVSVHSLAEAQEAQKAGADFIVFGPVYFTPSKASYGPPQGLARLQQIVANISLPIYAIGGINQTNIADVKHLGVRGVALISAILGAADPKNATAKILAVLRR